MDQTIWDILITVLTGLFLHLRLPQNVRVSRLVMYFLILHTVLVAALRVLQARRVLQGIRVLQDIRVLQALFHLITRRQPQPTGQELRQQQYSKRLIVSQQAS